ncbi:hypothetical protein BDZ91DRAFT_767184 [Kalaharituber pfeilii]|nr:hypothetical protein BDZ91DRAFT_767184 [Kalaharituber pfeilii]
MTKNRNVHSLCLVLHPSPLPEVSSSPDENSLTLSAICPQPTACTASSSTPSRLPSQLLESVPVKLPEPLRGSGYETKPKGAQESSKTSNPEVAYELPHTLFTLPSKSAIFKAGVITPITPNFSPSARGQRTPQQPSPVKKEINGKKEPSESMQVQSNSGRSLDESPSWQSTDGGLVAQATSKLERYASLSNLPTPPLSHSPPTSPVLFPEASGDDLKDPELLGSAHYLASLIPTAASASPPSVPLIQRILYRFNLRTEVVALAGIILDTLSSQFVRKWRTELARFSLWEDGGNKCEVLALVALGITVKWCDDAGVTLTATTLSDLSGERFCPREINVTERLMLQDIGYGFMGLSCESDIAWAAKEIERWKKNFEKSLK